jgi:hypothetical protein
MLFTGKKIKCDLIFNEKNFSFEIDRHKTINDLYHLFLESSPKINYPISLRLNTNEYPFERKEIDSTLLSLMNGDEEDLLFEVTKSCKCSLCSELKNEINNTILKFCLKCNRFICDKCLKKSDVQCSRSHNLIDINPMDLKNSIKLWCINLTADLSGQITSYKKQIEFMNSNDFLVKLELWKNNLLQKLDRFEIIITNIFEKFKNMGKIYQNFEKIYNKVMNNLIINEREMNDELFSDKNNRKKYYSGKDVERLIKKLKINYDQIEEIKKDIKP